MKELHNSRGYLKDLRIGMLAGSVILLTGISLPLSVAANVADGFADLAERVMPAVVNISTSSDNADSNMTIPELPENLPYKEFFEEFFNRQQQAPRSLSSLGSGFVIDPSGYVVTNHHVIVEADEISVNLHNGESLLATVVGSDEKTDLALLKVQPDGPLPFVEFGDSNISRVGDWVLAIGNPFGLGGSVSAGIISARNRNIDTGPYDAFIQTDAAINKGNSGGPLFNLDGEVIGVNTAIISPNGGSSGIAFAVPADIASRVVNQLREFGQTRRGWLGVRIQHVSEEIADSLGLSEPLGALVASVIDDSPAAEAGIEVGDIILSFDEMDVREMRDLPRMVAETEVGKRAKVKIWRDERTRILSVELGLLEEGTESQEGGEGPDSQEVEEGLLGMTIVSLNDESRAKFGIDESVKGALVSAVEADSPAGRKGILVGDVIVEVKQEPVASPNDVKRLISEAREQNRRSILVLVNREGNLNFVGIRLQD